MYCFPAAVLNWIYYIRNNGFNNITFPDNFNMGDKVYNLLIMGDYMDTHPTKGTSLSGLQDGLEDWLDTFDVPAGVCTRSMYSDDNVGFNVLKSWSLMGGMMTLLRARYSRIKTNPLKLRRQKKSGHMVTITGLKKSGTNRQILVHDPAQGDSDLTRHSNKLEHNYPVFSLLATYQKYDYDNNEVDDEEEANALRITESTDPYKIIEGYSVIFPNFIVSNIAPNSLTINVADLQKGGTNEINIALPFGDIADISIKPGVPEVYVLQADKSSVWKVDLATREVVKHTTIPGTHRLVFGGHKNIMYAIGSKDIKSFNAEAKQMQAIEIDGTPDDVQFDYRSNNLTMLSKGNLVNYTDKLQFKNKTALPALSATDKPKLTLNIRTGDTMVSTNRKFAAASVKGTFKAAAANLVQKDDRVVKKPFERGKHLTIKNGIIEILNDKGGKRNSVFNGLKAGPIVRMSTSNLLFDPAIVKSDEYFY